MVNFQHCNYAYEKTLKGKKTLKFTDNTLCYTTYKNIYGVTLQWGMISFLLIGDVL